MKLVHTIDSRLVLYRRLISATGLLAVCVGIGTKGYWVIGHGAWSIADGIYMTVVILSTLGFGETLPGMDSMPIARGWTVALIVFGSGTLPYYVSTLTAFILESNIGRYMEKQRMKLQLKRMHNHIIVCGAGGNRRLRHH